MAWGPDGIVSVYLNTVFLQLLCSPGHAMVIKSPVTLKRAEAARKRATALETQENGLSLPASQGRVAERDRLIRRTPDPSLKR